MLCKSDAVIVLFDLVGVIAIAFIASIHEYIFVRWLLRFS